MIAQNTTNGGGIVMTKYNEDYLNALIAKAKKSWEGVDVDSFMSELRDEEDAEKEQKSMEEQICQR